MSITAGEPDWKPLHSDGRPPSKARSRVVVVLTAVIALIVICGVAAGAFIVGRTSSRSQARIPQTAATVTATLPVIPCTSTYGTETAPPSHYGSTSKVTIPSALVGKVALYSDSSRSMAPLIGPRGWSCSASIGVDGSAGLSIYPKGKGRPPKYSSSGPITYPAKTQLISAQSTPACQLCVGEQVCGIFPHALVLAYPTQSCGALSPVDEKRTFVVGSATAGYGTVLFTDPAGVKGTGTASGGDYPATGVLSYGSGGTSSSQGAEETLSCVLPPANAAVCHAIVGKFISDHWGTTGSPRPLTVPTTTVPTTTVPVPTTTTTSPGLGTAVSMSGATGDDISVRLARVVSPDTQDAARCSLSQTTQLVAILLDITNTGTTVLKGTGDGTGISVIGSNSIAYGQSSCQPVYAFPGCDDNSTTVDLLPQVTADVCEAVAMPNGSTMTAVQFDAGRFFQSGSGFAIAYWRYPPTGG